MQLLKCLKAKIDFGKLLLFNSLALVGIIVVGWFRLESVIRSEWYLNRISFFWGNDVLVNYFWGSLGIFVIIFFLTLGLLFFNICFFLWSKYTRYVFSSVSIEYLLFKRSQIVINVFRLVIYIFILAPVYFFSEPLIYARTLSFSTILYSIIMFILIISLGLQFIAILQVPKILK